MAVKELYGLAVANGEVVASDQAIHAGMLIAKVIATGKVIAADRSNQATVPVIGVAADDNCRTGNTFIQADPVGATTVAADGTLTTNNNAFFVSAKRALGDFQDELVSNVSDLVSGSTGFQGPRRGIGYFTTPGTQLIIDPSVIYYKTSHPDDLDVDDIDTVWAVNDYLTCSADASNLGKWVKVNASDTVSCRKIARIDKIQGTAGAAGTLYYITLL